MFHPAPLSSFLHVQRALHIFYAKSDLQMYPIGSQFVSQFVKVGCTFTRFTKEMSSNIGKKIYVVKL